MSAVNKNQEFAYPSAEQGKFIKLDKSVLPALSSTDGEQYATLTYLVNPTDSTSGGIPSDILAGLLNNTAYQDHPFSNQVAVTTVSQPVTAFLKKGWVTLAIDPDGSDVVYIGGEDVTTDNGFKLSASHPMHTVSSDILNEWYVVGQDGGEKLYVVGAYLS